MALAWERPRSIDGTCARIRHKRWSGAFVAAQHLAEKPAKSALSAPALVLMPGKDYIACNAMVSRQLKRTCLNSRLA
jgi:hypothetical protein